jgi:hypothetical protein
MDSRNMVCRMGDDGILDHAKWRSTLKLLVSTSFKQTALWWSRPGVGNLRLASHMRLFGCEAAAL